MSLAAVPRARFLARRVQVDLQASLFLRHITGGIRRIHDVFDGAAAAADLDQTDAHADIEDLVLPHESVVVDGTHDVVGDLTGFLERATHQQQGEFIAADAADRVRIAHRLLDEEGTSPSMLSPPVWPQGSVPVLKRSGAGEQQACPTFTVFAGALAS